MNPAERIEELRRQIRYHEERYYVLNQPEIVRNEEVGQLQLRLQAKHERDDLGLDRHIEGGHGFDPGSGKTWSSHSTENMACLVAGKVGGLKTGVHLRATGMHPARVLITAMRAAGYSGSSLGEVSGEIPGLRG